MSLRALGIAGSSAPASRSRLLVTRTLSHLARAGVDTALLDLLELPADALLARRKDPVTDRAVADAVAADVLVVGTPVYRATYSGQLKAFLDLFPRDGLRRHAVGLIATGQVPEHYLAIDHGLRPLVASLLGTTAAHGVYVTNAAFPDQAEVPPPIDEELGALAAELRSLAEALVPREIGVDS